jgi:hypothetical protein
MASRPVFVPVSGVEAIVGAGRRRVKVVEPAFEWSAGFALVQQQKNVAALHRAALRMGVRTPLEISSKSPEEVGRGLSAFSLTVEHPEAGVVRLESAFQASKVFGRGGPYRDLVSATPREAKGDPRLRSSGLLVGFQWGERRLATRPATAFYDWLYMKALGRVYETVREEVRRRDGFTDIAFNPEKSVNCQARSAALYVSLARDGYGSPWVLDFEDFLQVAY